MSSIKNWVVCPSTVTPNILSGKINYVANFEISEEEANLFTTALNAICLKLEEDGISNTDLTKVTAIFTKDGSFEFVDDPNDKSAGLHFSLAIYSMETIRELVSLKGNVVYLVVYIEELVHHFWRLEDEVETKIKVTEVINKIASQPLEITDIFPKDGLNAELKRQGKQARY